MRLVWFKTERPNQSWRNWTEGTFLKTEQFSVLQQNISYFLVQICTQFIYFFYTFSTVFCVEWVITGFLKTGLDGYLPTIKL